mmetsp:Transcript_10416/g.33670  ORF Transcript_10416/g.33670 Transcript_10416/m.33670 type:complete len:127 (+) Transcript_10416:47-427(+)
MLEVKFAKKEALALSREMAGLISGVLRGVGDLLFRRLNPLTIPKRRENAQAVREFQRSTASFDETDLFQYPLASGNGGCTSPSPNPSLSSSGMLSLRLTDCSPLVPADMKVPNGQVGQVRAPLPSV